MGSYLNPGTAAFQISLRSEIYIDKTLLLLHTNRLIGSEQRFMCVSRPRRFGKSMAANMLAAYYSSGTSSAPFFDKLKISACPGYAENINAYDVIKVNMQEFLSATASVTEMLDALQQRVVNELRRAYPDIVHGDKLVWIMQDVYNHTARPFIILIDEWDCLFREYREDKAAQKQYLDFLKLWFKDQTFVGLAYMTGILPIKKYGTHSALNMFTEYSMTNPRELGEFYGFTEDEVRGLCSRYNMTYEEAEAWYDGYTMISKNGELSIYNPKSVVEAMMARVYDTYWNQTETYEALKVYIQMNMDGLKDAIVTMLGGQAVPINTGTFTNDMTTFSSRDDVLTLLVHLGYLSYHWEGKTVTIPNREVAQEYVNAISTMSWNEVSRAVTASQRLLEAMWQKDADAVAAGVDAAHEEISILKYNDENSLACTISLAFYAAREYYNIYRELPAGKGFADLVFIPRHIHADKPAAIVELKKDKSADGAIAQIKDKRYAGALKGFDGRVLLVGINYDGEKNHSCVIEEYSQY